ncbi:unnamed protein product [Closterium sp. Naga37s-1]|nr:unnamed protein product [Closterium sp. Naga37s-1]
MGSTFGELGYACAINVAVLAGMLVAYTILSKQPLNARVYFTKWFSLNDRVRASTTAASPRAASMSVPRPPCPHCPLLRSPRAARAAFPGPREAFTSLAVCPRCRTPPPAASLRAFPCGAPCRGAPSHVVRHAEARAVERAGRDAWPCPSRRLLAAPPSLIPPSHVAMALLNPPLLLLPAPPRPSSPLLAPPRPSLPLSPIPPLTRQEAAKYERVKMKGGNVEAAEKYEKVKMKGNVVKRRQWLNLSLRSYRSAFSWVGVALAMPERELIAHAGLDNVVFLHALKLGCVRVGGTRSSWGACGWHQGSKKR